MSVFGTLPSHFWDSLWTGCGTYKQTYINYTNNKLCFLKIILFFLCSKPFNINFLSAFFLAIIGAFYDAFEEKKKLKKSFGFKKNEGFNICKKVLIFQNSYKKLSFNLTWMRHLFYALQKVSKNLTSLYNWQRTFLSIFYL